MAQTLTEAPKSMLVAASRTAATAGLLLVMVGVFLLVILCLNRQTAGADILAAISFAAGYLLHSGVSLVRSAF